MKFTCEKFPSLTVYCEGNMLQFTNGKFETTDKTQIETLKNVVDVEAVEEKKSK